MNKRYLAALLLSLVPAIASASALSDAAAALAPGQSVKLATSGLRTALNVTGPLFAYGNTGMWDAAAGRALWIGKQANSAGYFRLYYDEATNTWGQDQDLHAEMLSGGDAAYGHGYDGNALDPTTGDQYFRLNDGNGTGATYVYHYQKASNLWSRIDYPTTPTSSQEAIEWWNGRGLVFSDSYGVYLWGGSSWSTLATNAQVAASIGYHSFGEYQPTANLYVFGGGNSAPKTIYRLDAANNLTLLGAAPINLGSNNNGQGIMAYDPASGKMVVWSRGVPGVWYEYDPVTDVWASLNQNANGSVPGDGTPTLTNAQTVAIPIPQYGVIMYVTDNVAPTEVWLYRHSAQANGGSLLQTFGLTSSQTGTVPFTVGLGFKRGDTTAPTLDLADYQCVTKRAWNDGSVKHAICSGQYVSTAGTPTTVNVYAGGTPPSGTALTAADIATANPSASVQLGTLGTVDLSDLLGSPVRTWISGPEMVEAHYQGSVAGQPNLVVRFYVRLYANGRVWVRAAVDNSPFLAIGGSVQTYTPTVTVGGSAVLGPGGAELAHYDHTRWCAEGWVGADPQVSYAADTGYLLASGLVPNYRWHSPSPAALDALTQTYVPLARGGWTANMAATGFQAQIGLLPLWDALYLTSGGDARAYAAVIANAKHLYSYPVVWRDDTTSGPIALSDWPTWTLLGADGGGTNGAARGGLAWELAHHGSGGYLAYLLTGDYYYLELMLDQAAMGYLCIHSAAGSGSSRQIQGPPTVQTQTRGIAWTARTAGQVAAIGPLENSAVGDLRAWVGFHATNWAAIKNSPGANAIGILHSREVSNSAYGPGHIAAWQQDFWVSVMGYVSDLEPLADMSTWNAVRDYLYRIPVGRLGPNGPDSYCFTAAARYDEIVVAPGQTSDPRDYFDTWGAVWTSSYGDDNTTCGAALTGALSAAPESAATGYWGNLLPAIAYAVEDGAPGASAAWARLTGATNWSSVETSGFADTPIWGVWPRAIPDPPSPGTTWRGSLRGALR